MHRIIISILAIFLLLPSVQLFAEKPSISYSPELVLEEDDNDEHYIFPQSTIYSMDEDKNIYCILVMESIIRKFDKKGKFIFEFGRQGEGPEEFMYPFKIENIEDKYIVYSRGKISYFTKDLQFIKTEQRLKYRSNKLEISKDIFLDAGIDEKNSMVKLFIGKSINEIDTLIEEQPSKYEKIDYGPSAQAIRWMNPFVFNLDSQKNPIYGYLHKFVIKKYENGKSKVLTSYAYTKRKRIFENGKPDYRYISEYYSLIRGLKTDLKDNIWINVVSNEFTGLIRLSRDGKETGRYPFECCNLLPLLFFPFEDYLYYFVFDEMTGIKIYRIKL